MEPESSTDFPFSSDQKLNININYIRQNSEFNNNINKIGLITVNNKNLPANMSIRRRLRLTNAQKARLLEIPNKLEQVKRGLEGVIGRLETLETGVKDMKRKNESPSKRMILSSGGSGHIQRNRPQQSLNIYNAEQNLQGQIYGGHGNSCVNLNENALNAGQNSSGGNLNENVSNVRSSERGRRSRNRRRVRVSDQGGRRRGQSSDSNSRSSREKGNRRGTS